MPALIRRASPLRRGWRSRRPQKQNLFLASIGEKIFHSFSQRSLRKNIKKVLTRYIHSNTTNVGESRGPPISRNCETDRDAFARPVFGRLFRLVLRGDGLLFRRVRGECASSA